MASRSQVAASVSTTFGGVPRVCRGPSMHWTATCGGHPQLHRPAGHLLGQPAGAGLHRRADDRPRRLLGLAGQPRPHRLEGGAQLLGRDRRGRPSAGRDGARRNGADRGLRACRTGRAGSRVQAARSSASGRSSSPSTTRASPPVVPSSVTGTPARCGGGSHGAGVGRRDDGAGGGLAEQRGERVAVQLQAGADAVAQRRLGEGLRQAAVGEVVGGADQALAAEARRAARPARARPARSTAGGCPPRWPCTTLAQAEPPNSGRVSPSSSTVSPSARQPPGIRRRTSSCTPRTPMTGVGLIGDVAGLVVEADVAAGDRQAELAAAVGQAADGLGELPHDLGLLRGAEVQAVGDGERLRAGHGDVAVGLGEVQLGAGVRVEPGEAGVAVEGERDAAVAAPRRCGRRRRPRAGRARCCRGRSGRTAR